MKNTIGSKEAIEILGISGRAKLSQMCGVGYQTKKSTKYPYKSVLFENIHWIWEQGQRVFFRDQLEKFKDSQL